MNEQDKWYEIKKRNNIRTQHIKMNFNLFDIIINRIIRRLDVPFSREWNKKVKKVVVLLSSSRSGSSLIHNLLTRSPNIAYLSGEEEPWFLLTKNTFPYKSPSGMIKNKQKLLDYIKDDLGINSVEVDINWLIRRWRNRLIIQFPLKFKKFSNISNIIKREYSKKDHSYYENSKRFLKKVLKNKSKYYDLLHDSHNIFKENVVIEQPPFVIPSNTRPIYDKDYSSKVFLFKSPMHSYRKEKIWKILFPNAEIKYIHLTRGFAQTINGLMDGWLFSNGFHSYDLSIINQRLNISGYSDSKRWKFDLPPNYMELLNSSLEEVCLNQWYMANKSILDSFKDAYQIKFEEFLINPKKFLKKITNFIGIPTISFKNLLDIMITEKPKTYRWHKRKTFILKISKDYRVLELMKRMGYKMNHESWV